MNEQDNSLWETAIDNVKNTYQELERLHGKRGVDWELIGQAFDGEYDHMQIKLKDGTIKTEKIRIITPYFEEENGEKAEMENSRLIH